MLWGNRGEIFSETLDPASQTFWKEILFDLILHSNCLFLEIWDSHGRGKYSGFLLLGGEKRLFNRQTSMFRDFFFYIFSLEKWSVYGSWDYFCREVCDLLLSKICSLGRSHTAAHFNNNRISLSGTLEKTCWSFLYREEFMWWRGPSRISSRALSFCNMN